MGSSLTGGLSGVIAVHADQTAPLLRYNPGVFPTLPETIGGMTLQELDSDYHDRLFSQYLPFWDRGGYDPENGGFMCELYDDGTVQNDEKFIWYQGRAVWVYSFLYNNFGKDRRFLEIARKTKDFMVERMYRGGGKWYDSVNRAGKPVVSTGQGTSDDIYGAMFAAAGLIEYYRAVGDDRDLELAKTCIGESMKAYENPGYTGITIGGIDRTGLRTQGHSFMVVWILTQLLSFYNDPAMEKLQREHVGHIMNHFWNTDYGIVNENLYHDYSRIPDHDRYMMTGHSLETLWIILNEALRIRDRELFAMAKNRFRRLVEMSWDYVFEGCGTTAYYVFDTPDHGTGPDFSLKDMWTHTEILIGCMTILEYTGEVWAKEWYERARAYVLMTMANTGIGIWRQAVDRFGVNAKRPGISIYRKCNFHQPRCLMMNMLSLDRLIRNNGRITPFPS